LHFLDWQHSGILGSCTLQTLQEIIEAQAQHPELIIRPRCAPHYKRIAHQLKPSSALNQISGREGDGCIAGIHYARVKHNGELTSCPYIEHAVGNIQTQSFSSLWQSAPEFKQLREPSLQGRCGRCEYQQLCGGCRARPVAAGQGIMQADTFCTYTPGTHAVIAPLRLESGAVTWSDAAEQRLKRIPRFVRKMVKKRAEAYVAEQGETIVTSEHLGTLSARRFGANGSKPPAWLKAKSKPKPDQAVSGSFKRGHAND